MSASVYNIIIAAVSVGYVFAVVAFMDFFVRKGFPQELSRKVVHIAAGSWLVFWIFFDQSNYSKYFNIAPAAIWAVLLLIKGFTAKEDDEAVKTMTRTGDKKELLRGPFYFTIVMIVMGTLFFYESVAAVSMGILGWGDGIAPLVGKKYGKHKYNFVTEKSYEGSLAFFLFGVFGACLFSYILFDEIYLKYIIICSVFTTFIEAVSPKDIDNILIPLACIFVYFFM